MSLSIPESTPLRQTATVNNLIRATLVAIAGFLLQGCGPSGQAAAPSAPVAEATQEASAEAPLAPISVSGSYWIELSPVLVAANRFYPEQLTVGEGGITRISAGEADLATNAETQLLRESVTVAEATEALQADPESYWSHVSDITGFTVEEIGWGWPEMEFPVEIIPDMLDVLEVEEVWAAKELDREPRSREELARLIDRSVVEEALAAE